MLSRAQLNGTDVQQWPNSLKTQLYYLLCKPQHVISCSSKLAWTILAHSTKFHVNTQIYIGLKLSLFFTLLNIQPSYLISILFSPSTVTKPSKDSTLKSYSSNSPMWLNYVIRYFQSLPSITVLWSHYKLSPFNSASMTLYCKRLFFFSFFFSAQQN